MWHDNTHTNSYSLHNIHTHTFHPFVCVCLFVFIASFRFDFVIPMHTDGFVSGRRCALGALFRSHCRIASAPMCISLLYCFYERKITSITTIANIIYFDHYNANCKFFVILIRIQIFRRFEHDKCAFGSNSDQNCIDHKIFRAKLLERSKSYQVEMENCVEYDLENWQRYLIPLTTDCEWAMQRLNK